MLLALLAGSFTAVSACEPAETWELQTAEDSGSACLAGEADALAEVQVVAQVCLSSSCDRAPEGTCTATLDGTTITVESTFTWETNTSAQECTTDCGRIEATCQVGPLAAGDYTVEHGDETWTITVPTDPGPCAPQG